MSDSKAETLDSIRTIAKAVDSTESKIKTLREQAKEIVEAMPQYAAVEESTIALKAAREKLKLALMNNSSYNNLLEKIAQEAETLDDDKDVLSDYLIEYYAETHEKQVEINTINGDARPIDIKAKLGKEKQKYQTHMFGSGVSVEITGENEELLPEPK